jgi:dipeptidyl aminopeptidase/acylaminoacyl peptidase
VVVTVQSERQANLWIAPDADANRATQITFTNYEGLSGISWTPEGKIVSAPNKLAVRAVEGGEPKIICDLPKFSGRFTWTPDAQAIAYVSDRNGFTNIWIQPLDGGAPRQLTDFKSDRIFSFDWSRDGKQLACARGIVTSNIVQISDLR